MRHFLVACVFGAGACTSPPPSSPATSASPPAPEPTNPAPERSSEYADPAPTMAAQAMCNHYGPCQTKPPFPSGLEAFRRCFAARRSDEISQTLSAVISYESEDEDAAFSARRDEHLIPLAPPMTRLLKEHVKSGVTDPSDTADTIRYFITHHPVEDGALFQIWFGIPNHGGRIEPLTLSCNGTVIPIRGGIHQHEKLPSGGSFVLTLEYPRTKQEWTIASLYVLDTPAWTIRDHGSLPSRLRQPFRLDAEFRNERDSAGRLQTLLAQVRITGDGAQDWAEEFRIFHDGKLWPLSLPPRYSAMMGEVTTLHQLERPLTR